VCELRNKASVVLTDRTSGSQPEGEISTTSRRSKRERGVPSPFL